MNNELTIIQLNNPSKDILEDNLNNLSPTIITNTMEQWNALSLFTIENLKKKNITKEIKLNKSIIEQEKTDNVLTPANEFLNWISKQPINEIPKNKFYLSEDETFLKLFNLYDTFNSFASYYLSPLSICKSYPIWIGPKGTKTGIHWDPEYRNIICQLYGTKKIYLFAPDQQKYLYTSNKYDNGSKTSSINFWNIDNKKYPLFSKARYIEIILNKGQMLYIPKYWWHACENQTTSISISIRSYIPSDIITNFPNACLNIAHRMGLYKKNNCTCHILS
jgi:hypothetical protein